MPEAITQKELRNQSGEIMRRLAATALAAKLPLYTRHPNDFKALDDLLEIVAV